MENDRPPWLTPVHVELDLADMNVIHYLRHDMHRLAHSPIQGRNPFAG
jgi:hypothetical protein